MELTDQEAHLQKSLVNSIGVVLGRPLLKVEIDIPLRRTLGLSSLDFVLIWSEFEKAANISCGLGGIARYSALVNVSLEDMTVRTIVNYVLWSNVESALNQ